MVLILRRSIAMKPFNLFTSFLRHFFRGVTVLTLAVGLTRCTYIQRHYVDPCNSRAYVGNDLAMYLNKRYHSNAPVRVGIIPYSVPANLSPSGGPDLPSFGSTLAWKLHQELISSGDIPVVEVFNRQDWPGKKEEFFTGNFGAISLGREAGYDLVMVGYVEPVRSIDSLSSYTKLIDVESGVTVYYGKNTATTYRPEMAGTLDSLWLKSKDPSESYLGNMTESLARCIIHGVRAAEE